MYSILKTLLIWLIVAVLPVQGFAAAIKMSCGPGHHAALPILPPVSLSNAQHAASKHQAGNHAHGNHHEIGDHRHTSDHAATDGQALTADATLAGQASAEPTGNKSAYCSACSSCCVGAALPFAGLNWVAAHTPSETLIISIASSFTGFIPAGLERPPRLLAA